TTTEYRQQKYLVWKPVTETSMREETYRTTEMVTETRDRIDRVRVQRPVTRNQEYEQLYRVDRPVTETRYEEQRYTVNRPVTETRMQNQQYLSMRPVTQTENRVVDAGGYVAENFVTPGRVGYTTQYGPTPYYRRGPLGLLAYRQYGQQIQPVVTPPTVQTQLSYRPNYVNQPISRTVLVPEVQNRQVPISVTSMRPETVTQYIPRTFARTESQVISRRISVPVTEMQESIEERRVPVTVQRPVTTTRTRRVPVTKKNWVSSVVTRVYPVNVTKTVYETASKMVPHTSYTTVRETSKRVRPVTRYRYVPQTTYEYTNDLNYQASLPVLPAYDPFTTTNPGTTFPGSTTETILSSRPVIDNAAPASENDADFGTVQRERPDPTLEEMPPLDNEAPAASSDGDDTLDVMPLENQPSSDADSWFSADDITPEVGDNTPIDLEEGDPVVIELLDENDAQPLQRPQSTEDTGSAREVGPASADEDTRPGTSARPSSSGLRLPPRERPAGQAKGREA
ncbi:MAG: hypothetical protein AAFP69_14345, partial [Planctomycetota bacterium]